MHYALLFLAHVPVFYILFYSTSRFDTFYPINFALRIYILFIYIA